MDWSRRLHEPFLAAAFGIALSAGFGYGALLAIGSTLDLRPGAWYGSVVQAHGHAQLFGWVALFILGIGLNVLPKMRGTPLTVDSRLPAAWGLLFMGVVLRSVIQPLLGIMGPGQVGRALLLLSAVLETVGLVLVLSMLGRHRAAVKNSSVTRQTLSQDIGPFAQLAIMSMTLAFVFNLLGVWNAVSQGKIVLAPRYDQSVLTLIVYGVAMPLIFAFSFRTLPLFLRLPVPARGIWSTLALWYFFGLVLRLLPNLLAIADDALILTGHLLRANFVYVLALDALAIGGVLIVNACILTFVWRLKPWRRRALPNLLSLKRSGDSGTPGNASPDVLGRDLYGRFDLLLYSAFAWLVVASFMDILRALPVVNERIEIPQDAARHALVLGCLTLLILGMALRMVPGLSSKRRLAHPSLVLWIFVLGNLAALLRVMPLFFPDLDWASGLVAVSGLLGWGTVLMAAICLTGSLSNRMV